MPAATAGPFTAAISGFVTEHVVPSLGLKSSRFGLPSTCFSLKSKPAQNALSPAPVTMPTLTEPSVSTFCQHSMSASHARRSSAFRRCSRLIVIRATPSRVSYSTSSIARLSGIHGMTGQGVPGFSPSLSQSVRAERPARS